MTGPPNRRAGFVKGGPWDGFSQQSRSAKRPLIAKDFGDAWRQALEWAKTWRAGSGQ
jgi:hypothetical protein